MALSREVRNQKFGREVKAALTSARERGMTDAVIDEVTGVSYGTFHRWGRGELGKEGPKAALVRQFFERLGLPWKKPFEILGYSTEDVQPAPPEPDIPVNVKEVLRKLRDPNTPPKERDFINETLKSLAMRPRVPTGAAARGRRPRSEE